jgi:hypothetical protein
MDHQNAQAWLDRYVAAWLSYDPGDVALLFSEDVRYRYHPYDEPIVGRDAVVASWLGEGDSDDASTRDAPGTYGGFLRTGRSRRRHGRGDRDVDLSRRAGRPGDQDLRELLRDALRCRGAVPGVHGVLPEAAIG